VNSTGVSLVIPNYNMASDLERLLVSLSRLSNITVIKEVIVVNDGSTDDTSSVIASFSIQHPQLGMREVRLASRVGRYLARLEGAKKAHNENLLFLDTRLELP
jgi:glycosyltransferase involved in cell wall biosynthesis